MTSKVFPRTVSRMAAIQANFQHFLRSNLSIDDIVSDFLIHRFTPQGYVLFPEIFPEEHLVVDQDFFSFIAKGAQSHSQEIEALVEASLPKGWSMDQMEHTTRAIFRCAGFEIQGCPSTPKGVILNEYIMAAHYFLLDKGHGLVNAVLDKIFQQLRPSHKAYTNQNKEKNSPENLPEDNMQAVVPPCPGILSTEALGINVDTLVEPKDTLCVTGDLATVTMLEDTLPSFIPTHTVGSNISSRTTQEMVTDDGLSVPSDITDSSLQSPQNITSTVLVEDVFHPSIDFVAPTTLPSNFTSLFLNQEDEENL